MVIYLYIYLDRLKINNGVRHKIRKPQTLGRNGIKPSTISLTSVENFVSPLAWILEKRNALITPLTSNLTPRAVGITIPGVISGEGGVEQQGTRDGDGRLFALRIFGRPDSGDDGILSPRKCIYIDRGRRLGQTKVILFF